MNILYRDLILLVCNCEKKRIQEGLPPQVSEQTKTCSLRIDKDTQQDLHCDDSIDDSDTEMMIMMTITLTI